MLRKGPDFALVRRVASCIVRRMASVKTFMMICGADDFLVQRAGKERHAALSQEITDEFSRETISGYVANVDEVERAVNQFREAVQTVSMFGGRRLVWFKDVNFLADTITGRSEGTLKQVEEVQAILEAVDPAQVAILITAAPVDRRRSFPKWCEKNADYQFVGGDGDNASEALAGVVMQEARSLGVKLGEGALELLLARIGANTRLLIEEVHKLASYAGDKNVISEEDVAELTPNVAEGDFFEVADRFFAGDLPGTIQALRKHFYAGGEGRAVIASLQNRNRLLLQVKALGTTGIATPGPRGIQGMDRAKEAFGRYFLGATEKSSFNLFTQNPWYLGKLSSAPLFTLQRLIEVQHELIVAFEGLVERPQAQEEVLRDMAVRCLGKRPAEAAAVRSA